MWRAYLAEHYGDLASVVGLLISMVGFVATIRSVRKAKAAAEEARNSARDVVSRLKRQFLSTTVSAAIRLVREAEKACIDGDWRFAWDRCSEVYATLAPLKVSEALLGPERFEIIKAEERLGNILPKLKQNIDNPTPVPLPRRTDKTWQQLITSLGTIQGRLNTSVTEAGSVN